MADGIDQSEIDSQTYGPTTEAAVRVFQTQYSSWYGLVVDGIAGTHTLSAMDIRMVKAGQVLDKQQQQVEADQAHQVAVTQRANARKNIATHDKSVPVLPVPEMDAGKLAAVGMNAEDFTFEYLQRSPVLELPGTGGSRYKVSYQGVFIGTLDVQWNYELGGSVGDDNGVQLLKDHFSGTAKPPMVAARTDQELFQIAIGPDAGITLQTMVYYGFMGYRTGMTNEDGFGFSLIELSEAIKMAMTTPEVNLDPRSANAAEPVEGNGKGSAPDPAVNQSRGQATAGTGDQTTARTGTQTGSDPAAEHGSQTNVTGSESGSANARTPAAGVTDPAAETSRGTAQASVGSETDARSGAGTTSDPAAETSRTSSSTTLDQQQQIELDNAVRALDDDGGHSYADHGAQTTAEQH